MAGEKTSWFFRSSLQRSLKFRSRRWRRRRVVICSGFIAFFWLMTIGEDHHRLFHFLRLTQPLLFALPISYGKWRKERQLVVTSPEDFAQLEYGLGFESLSGGEQSRILATYRSGTGDFAEPEDERVEIERLKAHETAFRILRGCLLVFLAAYIVGYLWLPDRPNDPMNPRDLLDPPAWMVGIVTLVLVLPQAAWMWIEPDEVGEPRMVTMEPEA